MELDPFSDRVSQAREYAGLEENFLREVFDFLFKNQYVMAGDRDHVRAQLLKLIGQKQVIECSFNT